MLQYSGKAVGAIVWGHVANAGPQKWDYCAPRADYADVRKRVGHAFAEKADEIADAIAIVQGLSKEAAR